MGILNSREITTVKRMRPTVRKNIPVCIGGGTVTWSGSGASLAATIEGVELDDLIIATIQSVPTEAAYIKSVKVTTPGTITFTLSAANTSDDAVIAYSVYR